MSGYSHDTDVALRVQRENLMRDLAAVIYPKETAATALAQQQRLAMQRDAMMRDTYMPVLHSKSIQLDPSLEPFAKQQQPKKESFMFSIYKDAKEFIRNHRDVIFTVVAILLVDKHLLNGALKNRVQSLLEALLSRAESIVKPTEVK